MYRSLQSITRLFISKHTNTYSYVSVRFNLSIEMKISSLLEDYRSKRNSGLKSWADFIVVLLFRFFPIILIATTDWSINRYFYRIGKVVIVREAEEVAVIFRGRIHHPDHGPVPSCQIFLPRHQVNDRIRQQVKRLDIYIFTHIYNCISFYYLIFSIYVTANVSISTHSDSSHMFDATWESLLSMTADFVLFL